MTARLRLELDGRSFPPDAVVACNVIAETGRSVVPVPVTSGEVSTVDVEPGDYVVQATLATGETVTQSAHVEDDEVLVKISGPALRFSARRHKGRRRRKLERGTTRVRQSGARGVEDAYATSGEAIEGAREVEAGRLPTPTLTRRSPATTRVWISLEQDGRRVEWAPSAVKSRRGSVQFQIPSGVAEVILVASRRSASRIAWLPPSGGARVTIVKAAPGGFDDGLVVLVRSLSPAAAAMSDYLAAGRMDAARTLGPGVVDRAREMFRDKQQDPDAAAVAGYFLVRVGEQDSLGDWPANFAEWFPRLPDAAVIHAWQLLRRPGVPDRDLAFAQLHRAVTTGVPRYTEGLRLLLQGLQAFAGENPRDEATNKLVKEVRPSAAACDWDAVHTTYWGTRPGAPSLERQARRPDPDDHWTHFDL